MKSWMRMAFLALGICAIAVFATGMRASASNHESPPPNTGEPLPDMSTLPWEIEHHVKEGEFLYMLAGYYYMDGHKWNWIYEMNRNIIADPEHIKPGMVLIIHVPRGWEPTMPYRLWYERMREQYQGTGAQPAKGAPGTKPGDAKSEEPGT